MLAIYTLTMFVSATLLFLVQPMFARMVLPLLGGSPAVWNTSVVFYQVVLLAGYVYAHLSTTRLGARRQTALHAILLLLPLLVLPIAIPATWTPPSTDNPIPWLLTLLLVVVGLPFFVISTSSPTLQAWFARTGHRTAKDPYFLYAASNIGSLLGLLSYPLLMEQYFPLGEQSRLWAAGYGLLLLLMLACAAIVWRSTNVSPLSDERSLSERQAPLLAGVEISVGRRARWVLWALVPSSLMQSVMSYLSINIAPIPLLWVIPLAIYLLTFVLVFARKRVIPHLLMIRAFPILLLPLLIIIISQINRPLELLIPLHLTLFFVITMACHGALANDRPSAQRLTEFYLWISIGGALGGIFNALLAPIIFDTVAEYPLMLTLAALLTLNADDVHVRNKLDFILPLVLGSIVAGLILGLQAISIVSSPLQFGIAFGLPTLFCFSFSRRPLRFGLGIGAILLASTLYVSNQGRVLYTERSFFGVHRVLLLNQDGRYHALLHGTTLHGLQNFDSARRQREPLSYYYPTGPIGQVFEALGGQDAPRSVGAVGLGVGSIACYSQPGQEWTFYEIDPLVERIARNPRFFTFLQDCAPGAEVVLGDARLSLVYAPDAHYDLLILDAYSSDSIPLHLLTREALALYLDKLAPHGILAFHISNRYLGLIPVLANLSRDAGLVSYDQKDSVLSEEDRKLGKTGSQWVIMARETADLGKLAADPRWTSLKDQPHAAVWTDDFSSILNVLRW